MNATEPREHGILLKGPLVLAVLAGRKTQTRRPAEQCLPKAAKVHGRRADWANAWVDGNALQGGEYLHVPVVGGDLDAESIIVRVYPKWAPGDLLWVRETYCETDWRPGETRLPVDLHGHVAAYRADYPPGRPFPAPWFPRWVPSIHMPRWASRCAMRVTSVRAQRVTDISEADAMAEAGAPLAPGVTGWAGGPDRWVFAATFEVVK